jgi:hypothetical protein
METNETALFDVLLQMSEVLERTVLELERVRGAIFENDKTRERYLAGVQRPDAELNLASIASLRERLSAKSRELRQPKQP